MFTSPVNNMSPIDAELAQVKENIQQAKFQLAATQAQNLLAKDLTPDQKCESLYMQSIALRYSGQLNEAQESVNTLLQEKYDYGRGHQERGHTLRAMQKLNSSIEAYRQATLHNPALKASWQALIELYEGAGQEALANSARAQLSYLNQLPQELLGVSDLIHEGKLHKADRLCRQFLQKNKHHVDAMLLLADIGIRLRIYDDAEFLLESCVELYPDHLRARAEYLNMLIRTGKFDRALKQADHLLKLTPDNPMFMVSKANALVGISQVDEAIKLYHKVLEKESRRPGIYLQLGHAQKAAGQIESAITSYQEAYRLKPSFGDAFWSLANTKTYVFTEAELEQIQQQEAAPNLLLDDRIHLCFAAGKALEDAKNYEKAFAYYLRGNSLKKEQTGYQSDKNEINIQAQIDVCTAELFEKRKGVGCDAPDPIFIVGLPRAGSTLLEQILASHSEVDGTMELHNILALALRLRGRVVEGEPNYPQNLWELEDAYFRRFGEKFIEDTKVYRAKAPLFIDKMPNNFQHIGLIKLILPKAKIIDARRHPMACCFSGFKQLFGEGQDFTYGLEEIGRYYRSYVELMDHWDAVLPDQILRVQYEDVVNNLESQVERILNFCGLQFETACLNYHKTQRDVRTPSSEQVRQPIYRSGLEQWRHFEPWLDPLKAVLGPDVLARYPITDE